MLPKLEIEYCTCIIFGHLPERNAKRPSGGRNPGIDRRVRDSEIYVYVPIHSDRRPNDDKALHAIAALPMATIGEYSGSIPSNVNL